MFNHNYLIYRIYINVKKTLVLFKNMYIIYEFHICHVSYLAFSHRCNIKKIHMITNRNEKYRKPKRY